MATIIVAYATENRGIGWQGGLPWPPIPDDMQHFSSTTREGVVIMGRGTFLSLPREYRPLPRRVNIVVSTTMDKRTAAGVVVVPSLTRAITLSNRLEPDRKTFLIGGQQLYEKALDLGVVDTVIASEILGSYQADRFFPTLSGSWRKEVIAEKTNFNIVSYKRVANGRECLQEGFCENSSA